MESRTFPQYYSPNKIARAENAAKKSIARVITIHNYQPEDINILFIGCQGSGKQSQHQVADLMNQIAKKFKPTFILYGGDNFYKSGAQSPTDVCFENQFHNIYEHDSRPLINKVPGLIVLGNHDAGRDNYTQASAYVYSLKTKEEAELQQVAHSRLKYPAEIFDTNNVSYEQLPSFFLPSLFYSIVIGNLQIFILNSNTYASDYLEYLRLLANAANDEEIDVDKNQAAWFEKEYKIARDNNKTVYVAMHHPVYTVDKRNNPAHWDAKHYLDDINITRFEYITTIIPKGDPHYKQNYKVILKKIFEMKFESTKKNANYNKILREIIIDYQNINPDLFLVAHSHNINYVDNNQQPIKNYANNNKPYINNYVDNDKSHINNYIENNKSREKIFTLRQLTHGGGGDDNLQHRLYFKEPEILKGFFLKHGCSLISCNKDQPEHFDIHLFTTDGCHLKFNNDSHEPIQAPITDDRIEKIRDIVLTTCHQYENFLDGKQIETDGDTFDKLPKMKSYNPITFTLTVFKHNFVDYNPYYHDVDILHDIMNFLNQPIVPDYFYVLSFLNEKMKQITYNTFKDSLSYQINLAIQNEDKFKGKTIEMLFNEENKSLNYSSFHLVPLENSC